MLTELQKARIVKEQTEAFLTDGFGTLDLSGSPSLQPLPNDKFEHHDKFGLNNVVQSQSNQLKELAENPDQETIARIAAERNDPALVERVKDDLEGSIAEEFVRTHPSYYRSDENYTAIRELLDSKTLAFTLVNLGWAYEYLVSRGELEMRPGTAKALTQSEQLAVINVVKSGSLNEALELYLSYSWPDAEETWESAEAFLTSPETLPIRNKAARFCWFYARPIEYSDALEAFQERWFALRPVITIQDLDECYKAFQASEKEAFRDRLIHDEPQPQRADLENLSDAQIEDLTIRSRRARAQQIIAARGRSGA